MKKTIHWNRKITTNSTYIVYCQKKNKNFVKRKIEENEEKKNTEKSTCKKKHEFIQRRIIRTESNWIEKISNCEKKKNVNYTIFPIECVRENLLIDRERVTKRKRKHHHSTYSMYVYTSTVFGIKLSVLNSFFFSSFASSFIQFYLFEKYMCGNYLHTNCERAKKNIRKKITHRIVKKKWREGKKRFFVRRMGQCMCTIHRVRWKRNSYTYRYKVSFARS